MPQSEDTCILLVYMKVRLEDSQAFNQWYENEYIPAFVREVPGILRCRRFKSLSPDESGLFTHTTIYEFPNEAAITHGMDVMRSRTPWRTAWKEWEKRALPAFWDCQLRNTVSIQGPGA